MNHKLTTRHLILGVFIDYMLSIGKYSDLVNDKDEIDMKGLKRIMIRDTEFPIYTPSNALFAYIILSILNNQVMMYNVLSNIVRDLDSKHWVNIISKISEVRYFGKENSSESKSFKVFTIKEVCKIYPQFLSLIQLFIKEDLFYGCEGNQKLYPYLSYSSEDVGGGEKKLVTHFAEDNCIAEMYSMFHGDSSLTPETYYKMPLKFLSFTFDKKGEFGRNTTHFLLYTLSFFHVDGSLSNFEYLNENYDV